MSINSPKTSPSLFCFIIYVYIYILSQNLSKSFQTEELHLLQAAAGALLKKPSKKNGKGGEKKEPSKGKKAKQES